MEIKKIAGSIQTNEPVSQDSNAGRPVTTDVHQDTLEDASKSIHYFNGRLLTADSLTQEQNYQESKMFSSQEHFTAVRLQQGQVVLDDEFNNPIFKPEIHLDALSKLLSRTGEDLPRLQIAGLAHGQTPNLSVDLQTVPSPVLAGIQALFDLLPPDTTVEQFLDALYSAFPEFDVNNNGKTELQELSSALQSGSFPPADFTGDAGQKVMKLLTLLDPQLQNLIESLKQASSKQEFGQLCQLLTGRAVELLQALYTNHATIQDVSNTTYQGADDILFNGQPVGLVGQKDQWGQMHALLQSIGPGNLDAIWNPQSGG